MTIVKHKLQFYSKKTNLCVHKIFEKVPNHPLQIQNKLLLKKYLVINAFYSFGEFFDAVFRGK